MHGRMAGGTPATSARDEHAVVIFTDVQTARALHLCMTSQAEVRVRLNEHFPVHGTMWMVTRRAAFPQRFMLKDETAGLIAMAARALLVQSRHGQAARRFHDVTAVRIVALHTVHLPFANGMMLREVEVSVDFEMAREARLRIPARIENEFSSSTGCDVFAAGTVA